MAGTDRLEEVASRTSRGRFVKGTAAGLGAALAGAALVARVPGVARSQGPSPEQDVRILNFILELERLEAAFYDAAARTGGLEGELADFARVVGGQEREHVAFLEDALGPAAEPARRHDVAEAVRGAEVFSRNAVVLEDALVAAYNGQITRLTRERLTDAARIVSVEARHAAWMRDIIGEPPAEEPVDEGRSEEQVRRALREQGLLR